MTDEQGLTIEAAYQFGFQGSGHNEDKDTDTFLCTQPQLLAFAKACQRKGRAEAITIAEGLYGEGPSFAYDGGGTSSGWDMGTQKVAELLTQINEAADTELAPILEAEEARFMTAQGYVRGTDEPGKRWVKPERPFYGAECPSYPNCSGGWGLGCTHEIEQVRAPCDGMTGSQSLKPNELVAWSYELANARYFGGEHDGEYCDWSYHISVHKPNVPAGSIRNLRPLHAGAVESGQ